MKRRLLIAFVILLFGAVVNVVVGWGCVLRVPPSDWTSQVIPDEFEEYLAYQYGVVLKDDVFDGTSGFGWEYHSVFLVDDAYYPIARWQALIGKWKSAGLVKPSNASTPAHAAIKRCGWPFKSLYGEEIVLPLSLFENVDTRPPTDHERVLYPYSVPAPESWSIKGLEYLPYPLPYYPIAFGFVANSVVYATLLLALISGLLILRRVLRLKRGVCVRCKYDLKGAEHKHCPECGQVCPT